MARPVTCCAVDAASAGVLRQRAAFTLVELMVVTVVIVSLTGLALAGMAVARQRAKIAKTKSTIRKIHEIIVPHYEGYIHRRVPAVVNGTVSPLMTIVSPTNAFSVYADTSTGAFWGPRAPGGAWGSTPSPLKPAQVIAQSRLQILRMIQILEMPDSWGDVAASPSAALSGAVPPYAGTGPVLSYAAYRQRLPSAVSDANGSAECLHMIVSRGGFDPDVLDQFRPDEIGDTDADQAPEFIDAWGTPIKFIRWAPRVSDPLFPRRSPIQPADPLSNHDPLDPTRADAGGFALLPLVYSEGPDRSADSLTGTEPGGWSSTLVSGTSLLTIVTSAGGGVGAEGSAAVLDNITNHDLTTK